MVGDTTAQNKASNSNAGGTTSDCSQSIRLKGGVDRQPVVSWSDRSNGLVVVEGDSIHVLEPDTDTARATGGTGKGRMATTPSSKLTASESTQENRSADVCVFGGSEDAVRLDLFLLNRPKRVGEVTVSSGILRCNFRAEDKTQA